MNPPAELEIQVLRNRGRTKKEHTAEQDLIKRTERAQEEASSIKLEQDRQKAIEELYERKNGQERVLEAVPATTQELYNKDLLENTLSQEIQQDNNIKSVSKELFSEQAIDLKTEISHDEINNLTRLRFLSTKFGIENFDVLQTSFLRLRVSKQRQSRQEFISALQTENRNANQPRFLSRLFGGSGGGGTT